MSEMEPQIPPVQAENEPNEPKKEVKKRSRSANFSSSEKEVLFNLVFKYQQVVENKKIDKASNQEKKRAWTIIAHLFNAQSPNYIYRSAESLKKVYENSKRAMMNQKEQGAKLCFCGGLPVMKRSISNEVPNGIQQNDAENSNELPCINDKRFSGIDQANMVKRECADYECNASSALMSAVQTNSPVMDLDENFEDPTSFLLINQSQDPDQSENADQLVNPSQSATDSNPENSQVAVKKNLPKRKPRRSGTSSLRITKKYEDLIKKRVLNANLTIKKTRLELELLKKQKLWGEEERILQKENLLLELAINRKRLSSLI